MTEPENPNQPIEPERPNQPVEPGPPPYCDPAQPAPPAPGEVPPAQPAPGETPPAQPNPVEPGPPPYGDPAPPAQSASGDRPPPARPPSGDSLPALLVGRAGHATIGEPAFGEPGAPPKRRNPLSRGIVRVAILVVILAVAGFFGFGGLSFLGDKDLKVPNRLAGLERNVTADITSQAEQERKDLETTNDGAKGMVAVYGDPNAETGTFYLLQGIRGKVKESDFAKLGISGTTSKVDTSTCGQDADGVWYCQRTSRKLSILVAAPGESGAQKVADAVNEAWDAQ